MERYWIDGADAMSGMKHEHIEVGQRVRVTKQMPRLTGALATTFEGTVQRVGQQKTGSWFAHSKDKKLWLDRLELRKADGEIVVVNLDQYAVVEHAD